MSNAEREALIDHELCHMKYNTGDEASTYSLREHDIQEFAAIIARHGLWDEDLRRMDKAVEMYKQQTLPSTDDTKIIFKSRGSVATITGKQLEKLAESGGV
jgi:hypothetical protein